MNRKDHRMSLASLHPERDEECTPDIFMVAGVGNSCVVLTGEGIVVIDTPLRNASRVLESIRARSTLPIHTIIYTHNHADHAWTTGIFLDDAQKNGYPRPRVIAHEMVTRQFELDKKLSSYYRYINRIQFGQGFIRPAGYEEYVTERIIRPDVTYSDSLQFRLGNLTFELYHYMGETDDGTWVWIPERKTAVAGDLAEGFCPNIGNPLKAQRYELEWAEALETIAGKNPDYLIPGHGPVLRAEQVKEVCLGTASFLRSLHDQVIALLNEGCWIEEILERVRVPPEFTGKPWLAPVYGHPTFIIHGIHRRYAGWFNGNPGELFPSGKSQVAAEVVKLSGAAHLIERLKELQHQGNIQLALHLADFVIGGSEDMTRRKEALLEMVKN
ncbi:MAG: alkyl sulfatase dimerization domain-containing protein [Dehalococcoidia bacterium]|nr:alkyl sulfatase dimerization domain-containing protein [Dehalococcoidia bacterium]